MSFKINTPNLKQIKGVVDRLTQIEEAKQTFTEEIKELKEILKYEHGMDSKLITKICSLIKDKVKYEENLGVAEEALEIVEELEKV